MMNKWVFGLTIENKEFQKLLSKYPDDAVMAIAIEWNDNTTMFYNVKVKGVKFTVKDEPMTAVIIMSDDLNCEYETLMNGCGVDEEICGE